MSDLFNYKNSYIPIKYFLSSYRAYSDGCSAVEELEKKLDGGIVSISNWKIIWIGACAIMRTSVELFRKDAKSCIDKSLRQEFLNEWKAIEKNREEHEIYWRFLREERNNIIHEYEWGAYEMWMGPDGHLSVPSLSMLAVKPPETRSVLIMRKGAYAGRHSLTVLQEAERWVGERIFGAIERAGYNPEQLRNIATFKTRPTLLD